jgi:branched-chain amino acid transport system ATP-binding protein
MNPTETEELLDIHPFHQERIQDFGSVDRARHESREKICERIQVLDFGTTIASGTPAEVANIPRLSKRISGKRMRRCNPSAYC